MLILVVNCARPPPAARRSSRATDSPMTPPPTTTTSAASLIPASVPVADRPARARPAAASGVRSWSGRTARPRRWRWCSSSPRGAAGEAGTRRAGLLRPLAERDFRLLWGGQAISLVGDGVLTVAL